MGHFLAVGLGEIDYQTAFAVCAICVVAGTVFGNMAVAQMPEPVSVPKPAGRVRELSGREDSTALSPDDYAGAESASTAGSRPPAFNL